MGNTNGDAKVTATTTASDLPNHGRQCEERLGPKILWIRLMSSLHWYPSDMPYEEKSRILKLDLSILIFGCMSFFTKYLDQQSITNAYVTQVLPIDCIASSD